MKRNTLYPVRHLSAVYFYENISSKSHLDKRQLHNSTTAGVFMKLVSQNVIKRLSILSITVLTVSMGFNSNPEKADANKPEGGFKQTSTLIAQSIPPATLGLGRLTSQGRRAEEVEITDFITTAIGSPNNDLGAGFNLSQSIPDARFIYYCVRPRRNGLRTADFHFSTLDNCQDKFDGGQRATNPRTGQVLDAIQIFKNPPPASLRVRVTPIFACQALIPSRNERDYFTSKSSSCNDFPTSFRVAPVEIAPGRPDPSLIGFSVTGTF
jgi:hypothetical protein